MQEQNNSTWQNLPLRQILGQNCSINKSGDCSYTIYFHMILCNKWNYNSVKIQNMIVSALIHSLKINRYQIAIDISNLTYILEETLKDHLIHINLPSCYIVRYEQKVYYEFYQFLKKQENFVYDETFMFFSEDPFFEFPTLIDGEFNKYFEAYQKILKVHDLEKIDDEIDSLEKKKVISQKENSPLKLRYKKSKNKYEASSTQKLKKFHSVRVIKDIPLLDTNSMIENQKTKRYQTSLEQVWGPDHKSLNKIVAKTCLLGSQVRAERYFKKRIDIFQDEANSIKQQESQEKELRRQHRKQLKNQELKQQLLLQKPIQ